MRDRGPGVLAEQQHDPVAFDQPERNQKVGELVGLSLYFAEGHLPWFVVGAHPDQGDLVRLAGMAVTDIARNVVARGNIPAK